MMIVLFVFAILTDFPFLLLVNLACVSILTGTIFKFKKVVGVKFLIKKSLNNNTKMNFGVVIQVSTLGCRLALNTSTGHLILSKYGSCLWFAFLFSLYDLFIMLMQTAVFFVLCKLYFDHN